MTSPPGTDSSNWRETRDQPLNDGIHSSAWPKNMVYLVKNTIPDTFLVFNIA